MRSPTFTMQLVDLPAVKQLDLEYRFPAYTGLPPQKVDTAGDVAAIQGTEVVVHVVPTMKTPGGRIVLNETGGSPLTLQPDGSLTGAFTIEKQGFYRIELVGPKGEPVSASPQYTIDVVDDQAPSVSFTKPGRDSSATPVEELFVEAKADDDFGVKDLRLHYSVNGGPEKTVTLFGGGTPRARSLGRPHDLPRGARAAAGRLRLLLRAGHRQRRGRRGRRRRRATSTSCRSGRSGRTTSRRSRRRRGAAAARATSARCRSSSGRSSPPRSTWSATGRR